jgi:hypothetical protein
MIYFDTIVFIALQKLQKIMLLIIGHLKKKYFNKKNRKHSHTSGHYSQMIWKKTKYIVVRLAIAKN